MQNHVKTRAPSPRKYAPDLPEEIERAVLRALEKSPDERFATTAEFKAAIDRCDLTPGDMSVRSYPPPPDSRATPPTGREIEVTRVMLGADDNSESPTLDRAQPTAVDATAIDTAPVRLRRFLATSRPLHWGAALAAVALIAGINWLVLGRLQSAGSDDAAVSDWTPIASDVVTGDAFPANRPLTFPADHAAIDAALLSDPGEGERAAADAAIAEGSLSDALEPAPDSATTSPADPMGSSKPDTRPARAARPAVRRTAVREPAPPPAAAETTEALAEEHPQNSSNRSGGQGWIIERR
jgi:hypothetical protein